MNLVAESPRRNFRRWYGTCLWIQTLKTITAHLDSRHHEIETTLCCKLARWTQDHFVQEASQTDLEPGQFISAEPNVSVPRPGLAECSSPIAVFWFVSTPIFSR